MFTKLKLFTLGLFTLALVGCMHATTPIDGDWSISGGEGEESWYTNFSFHNGNYSIDGYPPLYEAGTYAVEADTTSTYTIQFEPTTEIEPYSKTVRISEDGQTFEVVDGITLHKRN